MDRSRQMLVITAIVGAVTLQGCAGSTRLTNNWSDPLIQSNSLHKLMVVSVAKNPTARRLFEDRFGTELRRRGIEVEPSYRLIGDTALDSAQASLAMHEGHCDGVFVTRIVDQKTVRTYYPPTPSYRRAAPPHYGGWYSYYSQGYAYVTTPGYTVENQVVNMETNLYRVSDGQLVWSALSRSWLQPSETPADEIDPIVRQVTRALSKSNVVARKR